MTSEAPNVVAIAQRMVLAVDEFIAALQTLGVTITGNEMWLLESLPRELAEYVSVQVRGEHQGGTLLTVRVPTAELPRWRERLPDHIAAQYQCSRGEAVTFLAWRNHPELIPDIQCNHPGCRNTRTCSPWPFLPSDVATIIKRATSELWYCHVHAHKGLQQDGAVSDHVADILTRMQEAPGSNSTQLGITKLVGKFLELENLAIRRVTGRGVGAMYHWTIADLGAQILSKRAALQE
ncbi:hypothetical protein [Metallibacterium scheffleri]|uniref:Uncharacterized protein n=1 Tax=Metallibacterium scheffleri TaxID=993689 RepID=A0A4S3KQG3_9GAMM|nr:hypothetical protein [Metallibacterium scheffleri]THD11287.1 hypothetical protein B1806_03990 [Metallibacterium scheffleri]